MFQAYFYYLTRMTKTNDVSGAEKFALAMKKKLNEIPRAKRSNGATQKRHQPKKFSTLILQEASKTNWDKKMAIKRELKKNQQLQAVIKEQAKALNPPKPVIRIKLMFF